MKETIIKLMALCPGRLDIQIDRHKLFNETAKEVIERNDFKEFNDVKPKILNKMKKNDTIIRVHANPLNIPIEAISYSDDLAEAVEDVLSQIHKTSEFKKTLPKPFVPKKQYQ